MLYKYQAPPTQQFCITSQKTTVLFYTTVKASGLTYKEMTVDVYAATEFMEQALLAVGELQQGVQNVKDASARLAHHFCEDPEKFQLEECFKMFSDFFRRTDEVHKVRK
jgi:hypothetical protein